MFTSASGDITAQRERILTGLAEMGFSLAERLHERAMAAETADEAAALAGAFHRLSRSVRQTLALQAKLERDGARDLVEAETRADEQAQAARSRRKAQVGAAIDRLIWTEGERDEDFPTGELLVELKGILDVECLGDAFLDEPLEAQITRICAVLGLSPPSPDGEGEPATPPDARVSDHYP